MTTRQLQSEPEFGLGDLAGIVRRRFWWFAIPAVLGTLAATILALAWPAEYEAATTVAIIPPDIPEELVSSTVATDTETHFGLLKNLVLARDNVTRIIQDFNLHHDLWEQIPMEVIVDKVRAKVRIEALPPEIIDPRAPVEVERFSIAFRTSEPVLAAKVANRLRTDFLSKNIQERRNLAQETQEFIEAELRSINDDRVRGMEALSQYKEEHQGELPEDLPANQQKLDRLTASLSTIRMQMLMAEKQARRIRQQIEEVRLSGSQERLDPVAQKKVVELQLSQHRALGKTHRHPDVIIANAELEQLEIMIAAGADNPAPISGVESGLRRELRDNEVALEVLGTQVGDLEEGIQDVELKILNTPRREGELGQLQGRVEILSAAIAELDAKRGLAEMGVGIELAQKGEQYLPIDTAIPPTSPISPNRPLFFIVGTLLGFVLGVLLAAGRELADQSFHSTHDLQRTLELPVLGTIPQIDLPGESRGLLTRFTPWGRR